MLAKSIHALSLMNMMIIAVIFFKIRKRECITEMHITIYYMTMNDNTYYPTAIKNSIGSSVGLHFHAGDNIMVSHS